MNPKISVIVPVYNTEKYLHRCVDSILAQTFTDFELLLVNDGSTDGSGAICDEYAQKDSRVRVFHKENGGVSSARNIGIDNAQGDWITFIDSDDRIEHRHLYLLYEARTENFSMSSYIYEKKGIQEYECLNDELIILSSENLSNILMKGAFMTPICKLFNREIIESNKLRYDEEITSREDTLFVWMYLLKIDKVKTISEFTYHYYITGNGLSSKIVDIIQSKYALEQFNDCLIKLEAKYTRYNKSIRYIWLIFEIFLNMLENVSMSKSFYHKKELMKVILQSSQIQDLLQYKDAEVFPKGLKRRIWDYLALNNHINLLVLYNMIYKYQ